MTASQMSAFLQGSVNRRMLLLNIALSLLYFSAMSFLFRHGNPILFGLLISGEAFHVWQVIGYSLTIWGTAKPAPFDAGFNQPVDVFITVAGEPVEIVETTVRAALNMEYPNFRVAILNDGYVAKKPNWREVKKLGKTLGVRVITRRKPGGAKAGNINHALQLTHNPFVVIFDADHVPYPDFLQKTMGYFADERMGFVQTPQYYHNAHINQVTQAAWDQQALFFGAIMKGKNRTGSAFMCGTNMVMRRSALKEVGGMCEFNIAEDFLTSLFVHAKGWKSWYVPEVLAEGLAPEDFLSYYKQQFRWCRGNLEVIFKYNPLFFKGLRLSQRLQYLTSSSYYLSGIIVVIDALIPLIFLFTGQTAIVTSTMILALIFVPYVSLNLYVLQRSCGYSCSTGAIAFSISSCFLQIKAIVLLLLGRKATFAITSKTALAGNFLYLAVPHLVYIGLACVGLGVGIWREGFTASLLSNFAWALVTVALFIPFIVAASPLSAHLVRRRTVPVELVSDSLEVAI